MDNVTIGESIEFCDIDNILNEYGTFIFRICYIYMKNFHDAEDALQETFIKAYQKHHTFRNISSEKTWLTRIAINTCKNHLRNSWLKRIHLGFDRYCISGTAQSDILKVEMKLDVTSEIMKLGTKYKDVILLYYYNELSIPEISEVLQVSHNTVKTRLKRAREKMKLGVRMSINKRDMNRIINEELQNITLDSELKARLRTRCLSKKSYFRLDFGKAALTILLVFFVLDQLEKVNNKF